MNHGHCECDHCHEHDENKSLKIFRIILSAILFFIAYIVPADNWLKLILFLISYLVIGYDVLGNAVKNIFHGEIFDENFLMSLATVVAFIIKEYPEAVAVMLLYQIGELFQSIAVGKSRRSISELMNIKPDYANVIRDGKEMTISPEEVQVGETIIIKPGEKIPLDGVILEGNTSVNTSALTGESLPRDLDVSDNVISGSINIDGVIKVKVTEHFEKSTVSKILELVEHSAEKKTKTENFITRFARYYTPCVVIGAFLLAFIPPVFLHQEFNLWINRALIFLVVSCPCALVISVPLSFFGGIGSASKNGILIKGSNYLEILSKVKTIVFDKTGTLTKGNFSVTAIHPKDMTKAELLDIAALVESYSKHPIANSIIRAHSGHIDKNRVAEVTEIPGHGIKAMIDGKEIFAGNNKLMEAASTTWKECHHVGTIIHIASDGNYCGHIVISDELKPSSFDALSKLKKLGIKKAVMLTGDIKKVGEAIGKELMFDEIYSELLPDNKVQIVEKLLEEKNMLAFVGDGINDAPVLRRADVGIAMGALGSDAAIEAADIVLMDDDPEKITLAIKIARQTMRIVKQNIVFALAVKAIVLILGAAGIANMWFAIFADVGVMILAILNAIRAYTIKYI